MAQPLLILDLPSIYYRAFYALPDSIKDSSGNPVNAIKGSLSIISQIYASQHASGVMATIDMDWRPDWRVKLLPQYKLQRVVNDGSEMPDLLSDQIPDLLSLLKDLGIAVIGKKNYEADDCIASLVKSLKNCLIVTGDRDLFQLINKKNDINIYLLSDKQNPIWDHDRFIRHFNFSPEQYVDYAILRGDASDGLKGVEKVGEKTAAKLILEYKTVEQLISKLKKKDQKLLSLAEKNILDSTDYIKRAKQVSTAKSDLTLTITTSSAKLTKIQQKAKFLKIEKQISEILQLLGQ
jgi:5'-3' exonuclease